MFGMKAEIQRIVETCGQAVQGVFPSKGEDFTQFFYTIGNAGRGLPELLVIGALRRETALELLNTLGGIMRDRGHPYEDGLVDIGWNFPVKFRTAGPSAREKYTVQAGEFLGNEDYSVQQVMICDREGRFPGDENCALEVDRP